MISMLQGDLTVIISQVDAEHRVRSRGIGRL